MNTTRVLVLGGMTVVILATGWFLLSHFVMETDVGGAINESLGVAFGVLVLLSVIGSLISRRGNPP